MGQRLDTTEVMERWDAHTVSPKALFDSPRLALLCAKRIEGQCFERKSKRPPDRLAETICAFANSNPEGGLLAVGIGDDGTVDGLDRRADVNVNELLKYHYFTGTPTKNKLFTCANKDGDEDRVLLIYVPHLEGRVAETSKGTAYVRRGDETVALRDDEKRELEYTKGQISFEDEPAHEYTASDLLDEIVAEFRKSVIELDRASPDTPVEQLLMSRCFLKEKDGKLYLTKSGVLVFGRDPTAQLAGAYARFVRYSGTEKKTGSAHNVIKDETFRDPLPRLIHRLNDFLRSQLRELTFMGPDGKFVRESEYPEFVWQEAVVNALVHRSYSGSNAPILIEMYDDRLEITSPGDYPLGVHPREFIHNPRNPHVMDGMRYLRFVRMLSEGSLRMLQEMKRSNLPEPEFSMPGRPYVRVILRNDMERRLGDRTGEGKEVSEFANLFRLTWVDRKERDQESLEDVPDPDEIKRGFVERLRAGGYKVDSFTEGEAVDPRQEYRFEALTASGMASIHAGFQFRILRFRSGTYLLLDHDIQVRNRATLDKVLAVAPHMAARPLGKGFVHLDGQWRACRVREVKDKLVRVHIPESDTELEVDTSQVLPALSTVWIAELLRSMGVDFDLHKTVKGLALSTSQNAARDRARKTQELASVLQKTIFPLTIRGYELQMDPSPQQLKGSVAFKDDLVDAQPVFSKEVQGVVGTVINGLSTYGSYEKPELELPLILLCTQEKMKEMRALVEVLRQGKLKFKGMEKTFAISFGEIVELQADSPREYLAACRQACASVPKDAFFLVFCPEQGYSRLDYGAPYYQVKHFLLEAGFPSQMVDEETISNPAWKDFKLALDIFSKAGHVPWVLAKGLPDADLFLGISYSSIRGGGRQSRLMSYVNVFDRYGKWLYYKGNTKAIRFDERDKVFADLLREVAHDYSQKAKLQRLHIHHGFRLSRTSRFEIARGVKDIAPDAEISFAYINEHSPIRLYDRSPTADGSLRRGCYVPVAPNQFFIATTGKNDFGQKGMGTPRPLDVQINRVRSMGDLDLRVYAQHVLSLTRLNWASTKDFCRLPITLKYASDIAYLMNVFLTSFGGFKLHPKLVRTPWFL